MRRRSVSLALAMLTILLLATTVAPAEQVLTLTASKPAITYLEPLFLTITPAELIAAPILVQRRYPDGEFKVVRTISASAAIEATSFVVPVRPEGTAGFRAVQGSVESSVTTVTVKARLSKPVVSTRVKVGRATVVKGFIWPRHAKGSQPVTLNLYWRANPSDEWQLKSTVEPAIVGRVAFGAKWSYRWTPGEGDRGWWKLTASHADAMHEANTSRPKFLRVR